MIFIFDMWLFVESNISILFVYIIIICNLCNKYNFFDSFIDAFWHLVLRQLRSDEQIGRRTLDHWTTTSSRFPSSISFYITSRSGDTVLFTRWRLVVVLQAWWFLNHRGKGNIHWYPLISTDILWYLLIYINTNGRFLFPLWFFSL